MISGYKRSKRVVSVMALTEVDIKEDPKVDIGVVTATDMVEEVVDTPHVSIAVRLFMSHKFSLSRTCSVHIVIVLNM
jgi:hypothetical protein